MSDPLNPYRALNRSQFTIDASGSLVIDVRYSRGFVVHLDGNSGTYQPCAADGTVVAGTSTTAISDGALVDPNWSHYKLVASGGTITGCVV